MIRIYLLTLVIFLSASYGQLTVSDKIHNQIQERENASAIMKNSQATKNYYAYIISGEKNFTSGKYFQVTKLENFHRFTLNTKSKKKPSLISNTEMRLRAMEDIKNFLPKEIADSCEITSVNIEYEQRDTNQAKIIGSIIMMHRKLDGISVRGGSYVLMNYDPTGLSYMDIQWEKYSKVPVKSSLELSKRNKLHRQEFDNLVETVSQDFKKNGLRGHFENSSQTWSRIETENGKAMLVPSITFIGQYSPKDSDKILPMVCNIFIKAIRKQPSDKRTL